MDITPNAVDHLNYAQYFPICVFLQAESHNEVKELRQKYAKHLKAKSSKRLFESAIKLNSQYSHLFTANVPLESAHWFKRLKEVIETQQSCPLWIPQELEANKSQTLTTCANSFDFGLQQQKFVAKQDLLLQQVECKQLDDNFELPMYSISGRGMSGAASTYSLYEDQNYRSSFASESDGCVSQQEKAGDSACHPIYSTNFQSRSHSVFFNQSEVNQREPESSIPEKPDPRITRVLSDSSLSNPTQSNFRQQSPNTEKAETQNTLLVKTANRQIKSPESCSQSMSNSFNNETVSRNLT